MDRSPYAPPVAELAPEAPGAQPVPPADTVDLGAAISYPFATPDWWQRCVVPGVFLFIPVVGFAAYLGWLRTIVDQVRAGQPGEVPRFSFGDHMSYGWQPFGAAVLTGMCIGMGFMILYVLAFGLTAGLEAGLGEAGATLGIFVMLALNLFQLVANVVFQVYAVEMWRLGFRGEFFPLAHISTSWKAASASLVPMLLTALGLFVFNLLGSLGFFLFCVGFLVTLPMSGAMMAHAIGQWDRVVQTAADRAASA